MYQPFPHLKPRGKPYDLPPLPPEPNQKIGKKKTALGGLLNLYYFLDFNGIRHAL